MNRNQCIISTAAGLAMCLMATAAHAEEPAASTDPSKAETPTPTPMTMPAMSGPLAANPKPLTAPVT